MVDKTSISENRACRLVGLSRTVLHYQPRASIENAQLSERMKKLGAPGFFIEAEPHLKGGGQFGGFSGPDGMGVAVRSLCRLLDYEGIGYGLRTFEDIRADRGF